MNKLIPKSKTGIHIKKENRGKFTKYCNGKVTSECIARGKRSSDPAVRKRATFAANARKWKHENGGLIDSYGIGGIVDAAGFIPGPVGNAANAILLVKDIATGNFLGAGFDLLGIIPGLGPMGKAAAKSSKLISKVKSIASITDKVSDAVKADKSLLKAAKEYETAAKELTEQELGKDNIKKVADRFFNGDFNIAKDRLTIASQKAYENKALRDLERSDIDELIQAGDELTEVKPTFEEILLHLDTRKPILKIDYKKATMFNPRQNVSPEIANDVKASNLLVGMDMGRNSGLKTGITSSEYQQGLAENITMVNGLPTKVKLSSSRPTSKYDVDNNATISRIIHSSDVEDYKNNILIPLAEAQDATKEQIAFLRNYKAGLGAVESGSIAPTTFQSGFGRISELIYNKLGADRIKSILVHENIGHGLNNRFLSPEYLKAFKELGLKDVDDVRAVVNELRFVFFQSLKNLLKRSPTLPELNKFILNSPSDVISETLKKISHREGIGTAVDLANKMTNSSYVTTFKLKLMTLLGLAAPIAITGTMMMKKGKKITCRPFGNNLDNVVGNGWMANKKKLIKKAEDGSSLDMVSFETVETPIPNIQEISIPKFPTFRSNPTRRKQTQTVQQNTETLEEPAVRNWRVRTRGVSTQREEILDNLRLISFEQVLKDNNIQARITSGYRQGAITKQGRSSWHSLLDEYNRPGAYDIVPTSGTFEDLRNALISNSNVRNWMLQNGYGILDETTLEMMQRTGATGPHFHIGKDNIAIQYRDNLLRNKGYA